MKIIAMTPIEGVWHAVLENNTSVSRDRITGVPEVGMNLSHVSGTQWIVTLPQDDYEDLPF